MQPTGFTPLTQDFTPITPSTSGTYDSTTGTISNLPADEQNAALIIPPLDGKYVFSSGSLTAVTTAPLQLVIQTDNGLPNVAIRVRVYGNDPSTSLVTTSKQAPIAVTNDYGQAITYISFDDWIQDATVYLIAYPIQPSESLVYTSLLITPAEYATITVKSNPLAIKVLANTTTKLDLLSGNSGLDANTVGSGNQPFQDTVIATLNSLLEQYTSAEEVNQSASQSGPLGGGGNSIYNAIKALNPELLSPFHTADIAIKSLQGATQSLLSRVSSWSSDLLHDTHSAQGTGNTEVNTVSTQLTALSALMPGIPFATMTAGYSKFVAESGKLQATAAQKQLADYAYGNSVVRTNSVRQYDVDQLRVQAGSVTSINSPTVNFASQQQVTQARFNHIQADIQQQSHISLWVRAEDLMTLMGTNVVRHNLNSLSEFSANSTQVSGGSTKYADAEWNQVGQLSSQKLHTTRSVTPTGTAYGKSVNVAMQDYNIASRTGGVNLNGANRITLSAPIVFINSSGYNNAALTMPKVFTQMTDPKAYPKSTASDPTGRVQINNETPEAPIEPGGPDLGQYTSSLGGNLPLSTLESTTNPVSQEDFK